MSSVISNKSTASDSDEIDLARLIGEFLDHKKLIISVTAICTCIAICYALFATPIYQADSLIQVEEKQGNSVLNNLSQMLPEGQPVSAPEISLIKSRMILGKTVDDLTLQAQVTQKYLPIFGRGWARLTGQHPGRLSVSRIYLAPENGKVPELEIKVIDGQHYHLESGHYDLKGIVGQTLSVQGLTINIDRIDAAADTEFTINYVSRLDAITALQKAFSVADQGSDTGMLNLTLTDNNPDIAQDKLESISNNYLAQNIAREAAQDSKSLAFLERQLPLVRNELDNAENKLSNYRKQSDSVDLDLQARSALEQIVNVDNQLNQLTFREAEVSQLFTKDHPTYIALLQKRKTLEQEKEKLNKQVSAMPATQQEVIRLSRDVESGRAVYMQLLNRQQELTIAKNSAIGNVRIIDDAVTAPQPVKPKKIIIVLIGTVLGLFISIATVLLNVFLRRGIESPEQLEELGINVYASIPVSEWMEKQLPRSLNYGKKKRIDNVNFLAVDNPADLAIEAIRSLRTSLHFAMMEAKNNILMISGASPNAGKTFVNSNLAAVLAQGGQKILFIDADMRKGYSNKIFNMDVTPGLSELLSGSSQIDKTIKTISKAGFDFIPRGELPPNPSELLMNQRFQELLDWASNNYDIVVVDTPPILAVTDATIIGRYVGTILLVARFEENTAKEMQVSIRRFEQSGVEVKGCILNGVVRKSSSYYSYGYNYYNYSYKDEK